MKLIYFFILIILIPVFLVEGQVYVRGYYRKDGVYVRPHYRTYPDGIPYNNYSFPGNYNPNTGKITPGDPLKYLEKYNTNLEVLRDPLKYLEKYNTNLEVLRDPLKLEEYYFNKSSKNGLLFDLFDLLNNKTESDVLRIYYGNFRIIDGDTFEYNGERFRIYGYDAPELDELSGLAAKLRLSAILSVNPVVVIKRLGKDKYGRTIAKVFVGDIDIVELLR